MHITVVIEHYVDLDCQIVRDEQPSYRNGSNLVILATIKYFFL